LLLNQQLLISEFVPFASALLEATVSDWQGSPQLFPYVTARIGRHAFSVLGTPRGKALIRAVSKKETRPSRKSAAPELLGPGGGEGIMGVVDMDKTLPL